MTKINVRECPAGPCLDAAVARVLGLDIVALNWPCGTGPECDEFTAAYHEDEDTWWHDTPWPVYMEEEWMWVKREPKGERVAHLTPVPHYSTDISEAWPLAEQENQTLIPIEVYASSSRDAVIATWWIAMPTYCYPNVYLPLEEYEKEWNEWIERFDADLYTEWLAETAPLAICRAFLIANGVTEIEDE